LLVLSDTAANRVAIIVYEETFMKAKLFASAGIAGLAALAGMIAFTAPQPASAAPLSPLATVSGPQSAILNVDTDRCIAIRHWCERRYPAEGWRWRRCVHDRGCRL
jgi:hypothetical protein